MAYNDENISDKLKKRAGTDFADFDDERLNRMYTGNLMVGSGKDKDHERRMEDFRYRQMLGGKRNPAYDKIKRETAEDLFYGKSSEDFYKSLTDWADAADAAGIKRVDSASDVAEIRKKTADEYLKRMIGAGVDGLAKAEDIAAPASNEENAPQYTESDTFKQAKEDIEEYEDNLDTFGDGLFNFDQAPDTSEPAVDKKDYMSAYKFNVANKMRPVSRDGKERNSIVQKFKDKQRQRGLI